MIDVKDLCFSYGDKLILKNISFHVRNGQYLLVRGRNGVGKTTLLKLLMGTLSNYSGLISKPLNSKISYIPVRNNGMYDRLTGIENIKLFADLLGIKFQKRISQWSSIPAFKQALETKFKECSVGMRQVLNIFVLTLNSPDLILGDEAFKSFDPETKTLVLNMIKSDFPDAIKVFISHDESLFRDNPEVLEIHL